MTRLKINNLNLSVNGKKLRFTPPLPTPLKISVDTSLGGSASGVIEIPFLVTSGTLKIEWGDASSDTYTVSGTATHNYGAGGIETIEFSPDPAFTGQPIKFDNAGDKLKLLDVLDWGTTPIKWDNMDSAFDGCTNADMTASQDIDNFPDVSLCTSLNMTFKNMDGWDLVVPMELGKWDTALVSIFTECFRGQQLTPQPNGVDGSSATRWDYSSVTAMNGFAFFCMEWTSFSFANGLGAELSSLAIADFMFYRCPAITSYPSISTFDGSALLTTRLMFEQNDAVTVNTFDVSGIGTSGLVTDVRSMWLGVDPAHTDIIGLEDFKFDAVTLAAGFLDNFVINTTDYSQLLINIEAGTHQANVIFGGGGSQYSAGAAATARAQLVSEGWIISDGGAA